MNLKLNLTIADNYTSNSQIARVLTEHWVQQNGYCPQCGTENPQAFENNKPVADFYCLLCSEQFELKSKRANGIGNKIVDGAYATMIERIKSDDNPNFYFLTYNNTEWSVENFLIIPKYYFTEKIIEKRKPLSPSARRAGWIGCNINLTRIPDSGRIFMVRDSKIINKEEVRRKWESTAFLKQKKGDAKGWILDVLSCVETIKSDTFTLNDMYAFEPALREKHPENNFIKDKIRQQLQVLRDKGLIEFVRRGLYRKVVI